MVSMFLELSPPFHCLRVARLFGLFGEESVYVRGLWSMLAIFLCIATYSCINLRSDDDTAAQIALKLINRKRNQHQISVINHLFIHSFLVLCLTIRLGYTCSHFSKSGKTYTYIQWTHFASLPQGHPTTIFGKYLFGRRFEI